MTPPCPQQPYKVNFSKLSSSVPKTRATSYTYRKTKSM